jgi:hypothetical protein
MRKSCPNFKPTDCTFKQEACRLAFIPEAAAAFDKPAPAVCGQAITGYLLEGTLALDGGLAPHQPVVPSLHGLRLRADRDCAGLAGGG